MATKNHFRKLTLPGLLGSILVCHEQALAQELQTLRLAPNEQVMQVWQQGSLGGASPSLARQEDGSTRLEWKLGGTLDTYTNHAQSAGGLLATPTRPGTFFRISSAGDVRAIHHDKAVDYFQLGMTHSNDPSVLSQSHRQINNVQVGRSGDGYLLAAGDIIPNFSSLSSSLAVRGLMGHRQFQELTVTGFTGLVADSWEAVERPLLRQRAIKEVHGIKMEKSFGTSLRTYVTSQSFSEREGSAALVEAPALVPGKARSTSGGLIYQHGDLTVAVETARSHFKDGGGSDRKGAASVVDATWRAGSVSLRAGYHDISNGFTSLALAAQPGIREGYTTIEWTASSQVLMSADLRRSRRTTSATEDAASTTQRTDSAAARASFNLGPAYPGWALSFQQLVTRPADDTEQGTRNADFSSTLNYASPVWNASVGYGAGRVSSVAAPESASRTQRWSVSAGHTLSNSLTDLPQTWSLGTSVSASSQLQRLLSGGETKTTNYALTFTGKRTGWGVINLQMTGGEITRPLGGPSLRQRGFQLDAMFPFKRQASLKATLRSTQRNLGDPLVSSRENTVGLQLAYDF